MTMLIETYRYLLADIVEKTKVPLGAPVDITMEWVLIEGPKLDKQLLRYLEDSGAERPIFPEWLMPLWEAFLVNDEAMYLHALRQLLVFCYKAEFEPTDEQIKTAEEQFVSVDSSIDQFDEYFRTHQKDHLFTVARRLVRRVTHAINWTEITPAHGPGAVYPSRRPAHKSNFKTYYTQIAELYPYDQYFHALPSYWWESLVEKDHEMQSQSECVCNLVLVPKDSRGPRAICVHPSEAIWIQQGQRQVLERAITHNRLTRHCINFDDQSVNGRIALESSLTREFATLDLKEASDRISLSLVRFLFHEDSFKYISCSRASSVRLPSGRVHSLRKFAPMGNCLTFPLQSLVFWALARASIICSYGLDCTDIYVFGDDIIYPSRFHTVVQNALVRSGLVPNVQKTFVHGSFRESCGVDAYRGFDITPYRMKVRGISSYSDAVSLCDLAKRLRIRGFEHCSSFIYSRIRRAMGSLPLGNNPDAQGIYEYVTDVRTVFLYEPRVRHNSKLHKWQSGIFLLRPSKEKLDTHDWYHVQDSLVRLAGEPREISERGTEYPIPYRERLVYGWTDLSLG